MSREPVATGYEIVGREDFSDVTYLLEIRPPRVARAARPGQFVIVMSHPEGERIPLTIADYDARKGTVLPAWTGRTSIVTRSTEAANHGS